MPNLESRPDVLQGEEKVGWLNPEESVQACDMGGMIKRALIFQGPGTHMWGQGDKDLACQQAAGPYSVLRGEPASERPSL